MPSATLKEFSDVMTVLLRHRASYGVETGEKALRLLTELTADFAPKLEKQLSHLPRQDSFRQFAISLALPAQAALIEPFSEADRRAIRGALNAAAAFELRQPANRADVKARLLREGHAATIEAERCGIRIVRGLTDEYMAQEKVSRAAATMAYMTMPGMKIARCGEHSEFIKAMLEKWGIPRERLLLVTKWHGRADHEVLLVSPGAPFDGGPIVPEGGVLVIDTWAKGTEMKMAYVMNGSDLARHLDQVLLQVDPKLVGPGGPVRRAKS